MSGWRFEAIVARKGGFTLGPVSFDVAPGEATAVLGANGSGKSTLLRALAGLEPESTGRVRDGDEDRSRAPPELRAVGYLPPGLGLFPHRTVVQNVAYATQVRGLPDPRGSARTQLDRLGLGALADRYPRTLSTGEQQRVAVARALAAAPRLLLWDEPASALDVATRHDLQELLRQLRDVARIPLVFVSHDPSDVFGVADRYVRLENGRVLRAGPLSEFGARPRTEFDARFLGFENVFGVDELRGSDGPLRRWLAERSGDGGVAFSPRALRIDPGSPLRGRVRRVEPRADTTVLALESEGLRLVGAGAASSPAPALGSEVAFRLDATVFWTLDSRGAGGSR